MKVGGASSEGGRLRTDRLRLDPVRLEDVPDLHAHWTHPHVRRFLWDGRTISADQVREVVRTSARLFDEEGAGLWALRLRKPGAYAAPGEAAEVIGCAGFWYFHEPPERELLISLSPEAWGHGLAREGCTALFDFAFDRLGWDVVQASADAPNAASLRLLGALGMRPAGERPGFFGSILVLRITDREWNARRKP